MFIIFFSLFVFLFTVFEQRKVSLYGLVLLMICWAIVFAWKWKTLQRSLMYKIGVWLVVSFCMVALSYTYYNQRIETKSLPSIYIGNGHISASIGQGKYVFEDQEYSYYLSSSKSYVPGDGLWLVGKFASPKSQQGSALLYSGFNQKKWLKMKGYAGLIYEDNSISVSGFAVNNTVFSIRNTLREKIIQTYIKSYKQEKSQTSALILGMLIGDKSLFSKEDYQSFIDSGLVHLVAVSGGNIVMLVSFLMSILFFIPFYPRIVVILVAVVGYGIICGMDSSVLRAVIMGCLSLCALLLGKGQFIRRVLGIAYTAMLMYNPYFLVYDVGFLLSFSAVVGLVLSSSGTDISDQKRPSWYGKLGQKIWKDYLKPTLGSTLGISPILIFFMGKVNILGLVGNLFILPLVPSIMIGGILGMIIPGWIGQFLFWGERWLVDWVFIVAKNLSEQGIYLLVDNIWIKYGVVIVSGIVIFGYQIFFSFSSKRDIKKDIST